MVNFNLHIIDHLKERSELTPDFPSFKKKHSVTLFLYDDFKTNCFNNKYMLKHGRFLGKGRTHTSFYTLKETKDDEPVLLDSIASESGFVHGEVWAVPPEFILVMDQIKQNKRLFERQKRSILLLDQLMPNSLTGRPFAQAYVYIGIPEIWEKVSLINTSAYVTAGKTGKRSKFFEWIPSRTDLFDNQEEAWKYPYNGYYGGEYSYIN